MGGRGKGAKKEAAPAADSSDLLAVGTKVTALFSDGKYYASSIVEVCKSKKRAKTPYKVHYNGYGEDEDAWVGVDSIRSKLLTAKAATAEPAAPPAADAKVDLSVLVTGTKVQALCKAVGDGKWYQATVLEFVAKKKKAPVKVHYGGYGDDEDAWVDAW